MTEQQQYKRLVRVQKDRKIAGVCAGFGARFNVDPTFVRLLWIVLVLAGGAGILLYLIARIIMPVSPAIGRGVIIRVTANQEHSSIRGVASRRKT